MKRIVLLLSIFMMASCSNDVDLNVQQLSEKDVIEKASIEQQIAYAHKHLLNVGKVVSKLYQEENVKALIFEEVNKRSIDGLESEILVKDLISKMNLNKSKLNIEDKDLLDKSLEAFRDLDGEDWNPKIYIPHFEKQYKNYKLKLNKADYDPTKPVIVIAVEDVPDPKGYQEVLDLEELEELNYRITEEVALGIYDAGREMFIVAIDDGGDSYGGSGSVSGSGTTSTIDYLRLGNMKVKQHKEDWHNGRSEIHVRAFWDSDSSPINYPGQFFTYHNGNYDGTQMARFKRSWVRNGTTRTLNFKLLWDWDNVDAIGSDRYFGYVVFERDAWPATKKIKTIPPLSEPPLPSGARRDIEFRSWQSEYKGEYVVLKTNSSSNLEMAQSRQVDNGGVKYNFYRDYN